MSEPYKLYQGDNLAVMRGLSSESIDLIYIDPPYFSQRNYGDFDDRWKSMQHYLDFMVERLKEMHRLLKPTGSIYVHLDWHAVHYVKVEMDKIFGLQNFQNDISWCYTSPSQPANHYPRKHDSILFYSKSENLYFNPDGARVPYKKSNISTGKTSAIGRASNSRLIELDNRGKLVEDWWSDIASIGYVHSEILGFQTQKPSKLMERIILASSNEGDLVADFFCGSGSFIKKAFELGRYCIGCDMSPKALALAHCPTQRAAD